MYSDLFDQLGGGAGRHLHGNHNNNNSSADSQPPPLVSFKAGKMKLVATPRGTYQCEADTTRGEVRLVWKDAALQWQWYDRRAQKVVDTHRIVPTTTEDDEGGGGGTFERVDLGDKKQHKDDRIYVWTKPKKEDNDNNSNSLYEMYWMQEKNVEEEKEAELVASVNQYLADPQSAAPASLRDNDSAMDTSGDGVSGSGGSNTQVDALSTILENLGMPQNASDAGGTAGDGNDTTAATGGGAAGGTGTLTLADLQGAMAGINSQMQQQQQETSGPSLAEVVTPATITSLLEDEAVRSRLLELLPEEQRSLEFLEDNLRSPQVQQTLRSLTSALLPDDAGNMDGFYSVIANFRLDAADGQVAMTQNNPIQAFLDCILKSVEKEKEEEDGEEDKDETNEDGGEASQG